MQPSNAPNCFSRHSDSTGLSTTRLATVFKGEHGPDVRRLSADVAQPPPSFSARRQDRWPSSRQDAGGVAGEGDAFLLLLSGEVSVGEWVGGVLSFW